MLNTLVSTALSTSLILTSLSEGNTPVAEQAARLVERNQVVLAQETLDLTNRHPVESINNGFKENILLALNYLNLDGNNGFILNPDEVFAFHKNILPEFRQYKIVTQESGFFTKDGYKYVGGLAGNGVCHLASLINWVATEASLEVTAPTNHNFAKIPGIEKKYGISILFLPDGGITSEKQNLYIRNSLPSTVKFQFSLFGDELQLTILTVY